MGGAGEKQLHVILTPRHTRRSKTPVLQTASKMQIGSGTGMPTASVTALGTVPGTLARREWQRHLR